MMVSFVLSFFPRDVLDEILNLIESVSEDFPSYSYTGVLVGFTIFQLSVQLLSFFVVLGFSGYKHGPLVFSPSRDYPSHLAFTRQDADSLRWKPFLADSSLGGKQEIADTVDGANKIDSPGRKRKYAD